MELIERIRASRLAPYCAILELLIKPIPYCFAPLPRQSIAWEPPK